MVRPRPSKGDRRVVIVAGREVVALVFIDCARPPDDKGRLKRRSGFWLRRVFSVVVCTSSSPVVSVGKLVTLVVRLSSSDSSISVGRGVVMTLELGPPRLNEED